MVENQVVGGGHGVRRCGTVSPRRCEHPLLAVRNKTGPSDSGFRACKHHVPDVGEARQNIVDYDVDIKIFTVSPAKLCFALSGMFPPVDVACRTSVVDSGTGAKPNANTRAHPSCTTRTFSMPTETAPNLPPHTLPSFSSLRLSSFSSS